MWRPQEVGFQFLSTSPLRGTTHRPGKACDCMQISIHVPLAGDDGKLRAAAKRAKEFLSTSPLRGTTKLRAPARASGYFYPRPPCGGRPKLRAAAKRAKEISIHVPLAGDDGAGARKG